MKCVPEIPVATQVVEVVGIEERAGEVKTTSGGIDASSLVSETKAKELIWSFRTYLYKPHLLG